MTSGEKQTKSMGGREPEGETSPLPQGSCVSLGPGFQVRGSYCWLPCQGAQAFSVSTTEAQYVGSSFTPTILLQLSCPFYSLLPLLQFSGYLLVSHELMILNFSLVKSIAVALGTTVQIFFRISTSNLYYLNSGKRQKLLPHSCFLFPFLWYLPF